MSNLKIKGNYFGFAGLLRCTQLVVIYSIHDSAQRLQKIKAQFGDNSSEIFFMSEIIQKLMI